MIGWASSLLLTAALAAVPPADEVSGTWKWEGNGAEIELRLKVEQRRLSGAVRYNRGPEKAISEGTIADAEIRFRMPSMYGALVHEAHGQLEKGELVLHIQSEVLGSITIRMKRQQR